MTSNFVSLWQAKEDSRFGQRLNAPHLAGLLAALKTACDPGSNRAKMALPAFFQKLLVTPYTMEKRVFIIHGWEGLISHGWYPWLKKELDKKGFDAYLPQMPNTNAPEITVRVNYIKKIVGKPDKNTYFVGHSVGCQAILRYFESLPKTAKVGGAVLIAGWFELTPISTPDEESKEIVKPWLETPINIDKVLEKTKNLVAIFSDDDPYVPFKASKREYEKFCRKIIVEKGKKHMAEDDGVKELPSAPKAVLEIAKCHHCRTSNNI